LQQVIKKEQDKMNQIQLSEQVSDIEQDAVATAKPVSVTERIKQNEQLLTALAPVIKSNHIIEQRGQSYVCVAGGIAIANALGYAISTGKVVFNDEADGQYYSAEASLIDAINGKVIGSAEGFVGMDEDRWRDQPIYARRSMCQTRAVARLLRQNFGHIYVALGHSDTPSEEIPQGDFTVTNTSQKTSARSNDQPPLAPAPQGDNVLHVTAVDEWSKEGASWTKYTITFAEGQKATTFEKGFSDIASDSLIQGTAVTATMTGPNKWNSYDLKSIAIAQTVVVDSAPTGPPPDSEIPF
jgi:hypothetical protein